MALNSFAGDKSSEAESILAFEKVASVLQHPRCINCHVPDGYPRQGDDSHVHIMGVQRGGDGSGARYLHCSTCHQGQNSESEHAPPGAEGWRMPGAETPMAWMGLTVAQLCQSLRDPKTSGKRSGADLIEHATNDHIVNWGFHPRPQALVPPITHAEFLAAVREWVEKGEACPGQ